MTMVNHRGTDSVGPKQGGPQRPSPPSWTPTAAARTFQPYYPDWPPISATATPNTPTGISPPHPSCLRSPPTYWKPIPEPDHDHPRPDPAEFLHRPSDPATPGPAI